MIKTDSSGNNYIESDLGIDQAVRISFIDQGWDGGNCIRINLRDENNHIRPGAEFPIGNAQQIVDAINLLIKNKKP